MSKKYKICTKCVMDTSDKDIFFDVSGECSHCLAFKPEKLADDAAEQKNLVLLKERITGSGKKYDCLIGVSGGVDSSYMVYLAKTLGFRALLVHFDNGWNSNVAVSNIKKLAQKSGFDLQTMVVNWEEFKDLQRAFFKAGVIDIELITDHAITATIVALAKKNNIPNVLTGSNYATEHGNPRSWSWEKYDRSNILDIHKTFGERPLKSYPLLHPIKQQILRNSGWGPNFVPILDLIQYKSVGAIATLEKEFGWEYYGGKHHESVFTKFYQAYVLPTKFGVDKRRVHFSAKIRNGEISREEALAQLKLPLYEETQLKRDREFVLEKLQFSEAEFADIMAQTPRPHSDFASDVAMVRRLRKMLATLGLRQKTLV